MSHLYVMRFILLLVLTMGLIGCSQFLQPTPQDVAIEFEAEELRTADREAPSPNVTVVDNTVNFQGTLTLGQPCYAFSADVNTTSSVLHVTITSEQTSAACIAVVSTFAYDGAIKGLDGGSYQLHVEFIDPYADNSFLLHEDQVVIP